LIDFLGEHNLVTACFEDIGNQSDSRALDSNLDSGAGLATNEQGDKMLTAEPDQNDPYSVEWLDEEDVILRNIADGLSKTTSF
jgi:hypothetical protein